MSVVTFDTFKEYGDATKEYFMALINDLDLRLDSVGASGEFSIPILVEDSSADEEDDIVLIDDDGMYILADWQYAVRPELELRCEALEKQVDSLEQTVLSMGSTIAYITKQLSN